MPSRRRFLLSAAALPGLLWSCAAPGRRRSSIASIDREVLWRGGGPDATTWFHPRPCTLPGGSPPPVLMTMQSITGSDVFGPVHWTRTDDLGATWREPVPIGAFARRDVGGGVQEGVCDVVPSHHAGSGRVLAIGHNVYYRNDKLTQSYENRFPVYVTGDGRGAWSERRRLLWDHRGTSGIYTCGCSQRITCDDGDVILPISFGPKERKDRGVTTLRCAFDGERLTVRERGNELRLAVGRGLLEPSLAWFGARYRMTLRAEDGHGYSAVSDDGLTWSDLKPWCWDDGEPLSMSTTQQHWLVHGDDAFLCYTRKHASNTEVMRWRAPLFIARVDPSSMRLLRATERVVLPLRGDGVAAPDRVPRMGNFHTLAVTEDESWVTVGETVPAARWTGDLWLARVRWCAGS